MINRRRVMGNIGNIMPIYGVPPITTNKHKLLSLKAFGGKEQSGTPSPDYPIDIVSNNGVLKIDNQGNVYADGAVETIEVHGKNLFDKSDIAYNDSTILADGSIVLAENISVLDYILVRPNTTYTYSSMASSTKQYNKRIVCFDANKNYITSIADTTGNPRGPFSITGTTPANTKYVRVACSNDQMYAAQLEQGSTATTYEPYFNGGTAIAEMLLKVGEYKDEQSVLDGVVTRNVGIKVLDGTEDWRSIVTSKFYIIDNVMKAQDNSPILCSHYKSILAASTDAVGNRQIALFIGGGARLVIADDNYTTVKGFKQYLADQYNAGTPVIVVYPLATPTTEQVAGQTLTLTRGTNIIDITQASLDNLKLEVKAK